MIIKICGITRTSDAREALSVGADWIGINFVGGVRQLTWEQAKPIIESVDDPSRLVALVNCEEGVIDSSLMHRLIDSGVRRLQLYGQVLPDTLQLLHQLKIECVATFPLGTEDDLAVVRDFMNLCKDNLPDYTLVDASVAGHMGGTGRQANWALIQKGASQGVTSVWPPLLLAGGLTPDNVAQAIAQTNPVGVDVSSGVECGPGEKDLELMKAFVRNARTCSW